MNYYGTLCKQIFATQEKAKFIKSYEIVGDQILLHMATGEVYKKPYTNENEERVIKIMETQVKDAKARKMPNIGTVILAFIFLAFAKDASTYLFDKITSAFFYLLYVYLGLDMTENIYVMTDLKKQRYFLANQEMFESTIIKSKNVLHGISKSTAETIQTSSTNIPAININSINRMSLSELKKLKSNIDREYHLNLSDSIEDEEKQGKRPYGKHH